MSTEPTLTKVEDRARPRVGDRAPDVDLLLPGEGVVPLSAYWDGGPAVVVFLRYFGCPFCQSQVVGLREDRGRIEGAGAAVVLIGQGDATAEAAFREARGVPFPILLDTERHAYRAYGLSRGTAMQLFGPRVALPFLRANAHQETRQRGLKGGSFRQMPGTFVVDGEGVLRLAHRNRTVADNPSIADLLEVLRRPGGPVG
jgi:prostamide/prostaglandin F2alpha synthase